MRPVRIILLSVLILAAMALVFGCAVDEQGGKGDPYADVTRVTVAFAQAADIPESVQTLDLYVTGDDFKGIHESADLTDGTQDVVIEVEVPSGTNRTFYAVAKNTAGEVGYEGIQTGVSLSPGSVSLALPLYGRATVQGTGYMPPYGPSNTLPEGVDLSFQVGSEEPFVAQTVNDGSFEIRLPTRADTISYSIAVEHTDSQVLEAFAEIVVANPADRLVLDLFLIPKGNTDQPWICAVWPMAARVGDRIEIFGRGFSPSPPNGPLLVAFDGGTVVATDYTVIDDDWMAITVPAGANNDLLVAWQSGNIPSNRVPFTLLP